MLSIILVLIVEFCDFFKLSKQVNVQKGSLMKTATKGLCKSKVDRLSTSVNSASYMLFFLNPGTVFLLRS